MGAASFRGRESSAALTASSSFEISSEISSFQLPFRRHLKRNHINCVVIVCIAKMYLFDFFFFCSISFSSVLQSIFGLIFEGSRLYYFRVQHYLLGIFSRILCFCVFASSRPSATLFFLISLVNQLEGGFGALRVLPPLPLCFPAAPPSRRARDAATSDTSPARPPPAISDAAPSRQSRGLYFYLALIFATVNSSFLCVLNGGFVFVPAATPSCTRRDTRQL